MRRLKHIIIAIVAFAFVVTLAYAGTVHKLRYGVATPYWYGYSSGAKSTYYLEHPTLTANDQVVVEGVAQTLTLKTLTSPVFNTGVSGTAVKDEDAMTADSATHLATQQSIKAYVDAQKKYITAEIDDISSAASHWVVSPIAGTITKIYTVIDGAITVGDAAITFELGGTAITDSAITIAYSGSAAGTVDSSTPSALNTVAVGDAIECITYGGSTDAAKARITLEITPS